MSNLGTPAGYLSEAAYRLGEGPGGIRLSAPSQSSVVVPNTPVELHQCNGVELWVKREDLCSPNPGPQFSKIRGLLPHLENRPEYRIGILDTFHSKAGWATARVCLALGKRAVVFYPEYKGDWSIDTADGAFSGGPSQLRPQQRYAQWLGADLVPLQATAGYILEIRAKKLLAQMDDSYMLPVGLKMHESVDENAAEAERTAEGWFLMRQLGTLVISASSGTVASGVIRGLSNARTTPRHTIVHLGYSRPVEGKKGLRANMAHKAGISMDHVQFVDEGYSYREAAPPGYHAGFPINPYYDAKSWAWLERNITTLPQPVLFWNIGA